MHGYVQFKHFMSEQKYRYKIPGIKLDEPNLMNKMSPPKCPPTYHIGCLKGIFVQKVFKANLSFRYQQVKNQIIYRQNQS